MMTSKRMKLSTSTLSTCKTPEAGKKLQEEECDEQLQDILYRRLEIKNVNIITENVWSQKTAIFPKNGFEKNYCKIVIESILGLVKASDLSETINHLKDIVFVEAYIDGHCIESLLAIRDANENLKRNTYKVEKSK